MSRGLDRRRVAVVDAAVAAAVACAPGRVLRIAEAKIIEADAQAHAERVEEQRRKRGVLLTPADEHGLRVLIARLETADAVWVDATVDRVADLLAADDDLRATHHPVLPDDVGKDELRAVALGWLAALTTWPSCSGSSTPPTRPRQPSRPMPSAAVVVRAWCCTSTCTRLRSTPGSA